MKYSYKDWNNKSGIIPVMWKSVDYESLKWKNGNSKKGYKTNKTNYKIYGKRLGIQILSYEKQDKGIFLPDKIKSKFDYIINFFNLDKKIYSFMKYPIGNILPWHHDTYSTYRRKNNVSNTDKIVRIIVLLNDGKPGQQLWIGDQLCVGSAGSWFSWTGSKEHMAANLSKSPRYVLQITGLAKK